MIFWLVVGILAGFLAKRVIPGEGPGGIIGDLITGIVGAFVGGWLFTTFLGHSFSGWIGSTCVALLGAIVLLFVLRTVFGGRYAR
ncbi:MAG TPA: GlsB/YeaQ/YmgE family stress response membrane protein [Chthonomonadaceae bacterium]|nr:GlsB/YeaQ/YmgE family stress response membrane protein [Chthonomonadaceae bacterium]